MERFEKKGTRTMMESTAVTGASTTQERLDSRITAVTARLRTRLIAVVDAVAGPSLRPAKLVTRLQLDKSLSSRLVRALKTTSAAEMIHFVPSPTGLGMFVDAAETSGVAAHLCQEARAAIEEFQSLLEEFPGGRAALDTWISPGATDVRHRAERVAKQTVHRAMSHLLGFHCEVVTSALILQPSEDGQTVDGIEVSRRAGVRRLRPDTPVALFSIDLTPPWTEGPAPRLEPLGSGDDPSDPASYLIPRFCDPTTPAIDIFRDDSHHVFALSDTHESVHHPVTVTSAMLVRNGWSRYRSEEQVEDGRTYLLHYPCKLLVRDLFLRDDLFVGAEPEVRWEFPSPGAKPRTPSSVLPSRLNTLEMWSPIEQLGSGTSRWSVSGVPDHARLIAHAFATAGWEADRFRGYRARIDYPVPLVLMGWYVRLPAQR